MVRDYTGLARFLDARMRTPFAWGDRANDCVSYADLAAQAQGYASFVRALGVNWTTARGAARVLRRLGGLEAAVDGALRAVPPARAMRGDVGLVAGLPGGLAGASLVVIEGQTVSGPGPAGRIILPRAALLKAWSLDR